MILCKITNNTGSDIALNWIRGGISIPKDSAAVLDYDPFTLMDRHSNVYHNAMLQVENGVVSIGYLVQKPAVVLETIQSPIEQASPEKPKEQAEKRPGPFNEQEPYHENTFKDSVNVAKAAPKAEPEPVVMEVTVPKDAPAQTDTQETAPKKASGKKTKKL